MRRSAFARRRRRFANKPTPKARAIAACAGSRCSGSDGIAIFGATSVQTGMRRGTAVASRPGSCGPRRAITRDICDGCRTTAALSAARGSPRTRRSITACRCSRSGATRRGPGEPGRRCWPIGACPTCRSSIDPLMWRNAGWNRRHARGCDKPDAQNATPAARMRALPQLRDSHS